MTKEQIGKFIKEQREAKGWLQRELADKAGVRRQTVLDIENASLGYSIDKLVSVLNALGVALSFITATKETTDLFVFKPSKNTFNFKGITSKIKL
jgi:transcriptional regulator with XRE-family HTH domain